MNIDYESIYLMESGFCFQCGIVKTGFKMFVE